MEVSLTGKFGLLVLLISFWQSLVFVETLDNGLAKTPPMGWMDWERFRCNIDCTNDPENCISERLIMEMADRMAEDGFKDAGYEYVSIDDCWASHNRTSDGQLQPDPERFPHGMKALGEYIHLKGLKFGIYADYGTKTCGGYPGSIDHIQQDMNTFAGWGVDYLKLDGCYADPKTMDTGYPMVTKALNNTGRPIVFSCSWPAYQVAAKITPNYTRIAEYCNLWRNYDDIQDSWQSVTGIIKWYGDHQDEMIPAAGPGHWNDPDMLIIGDFGLSYEESKAQFAIWAVMASPLIMSTDLRKIPLWAKEILLNSEVIAVNQDKLGKMGRRVQNGSSEIWARPLADGSVAVVLFSHSDSTPVTIKATFELDFYPQRQELTCVQTPPSNQLTITWSGRGKVNEDIQINNLVDGMFLLAEEVNYRAKIECLSYPAKYMVEYSTDIGLSAKQAVARDLFEHKDLGIYDTMFEAIVNPSGVVMVKLIPLM